MSGICKNLFILEGGIAAGKTTLVECLSKEFGIMPMFEPVETNPYLEDFYKDPKKVAFKLQLWFFNQRLETYKRAVTEAMKPGCRGVLLDRSVFSDDVFAKNCLESGLFSKEEYEAYRVTYEDELSKLPLPAATLYLDVSPEICLYRIKHIRKRECEKDIQLDYLQSLHDCYYEFLADMKKRGCHVITLDWSKFGSAKEVHDRMVEAQSKIHTHSNSLYITHPILLSV